MRLCRGPAGPARRTRPAAMRLAALLLAATAAGAGCDRQPAPSEPEPTPSPQGQADLRLGVYGPAAEVDAFRSVAGRFDEEAPGTRVSVEAWPRRDVAAASLKVSEDIPDVFLASWRDLAWLRDEEMIQPVGDLLDERGVQFGDGYAREAVLAFSFDNALQCMPFGISPMVVYYNTDLIDFARMQARGLDAPDPDAQRWSFDQFTAAAEFATRPRLGTRGVHIEPTLAGQAPFIYGGDGRVFDDEEEPTSLAYSSEETRAVLETVLQLFRNPVLTLTPTQLASDSAVEWFARGRLGMIAGFRDLVPELRKVPGLNFDVMPMPVLEDAATIGELTGICLSAEAEDVDAAADLMVHLTAPASVAQVAAVGYLVPASLVVAESQVFLRPDLEPTSSAAFNTSARDLVQPPLIEDYAALERAVSPGLRRMMNVPVLDLEAVTADIDEASRTVLSPASPSPSEDP